MSDLDLRRCCANCKWWHANDAEVGVGLVGICKRFPPQVLGVDALTDDQVAQQPKTSYKDFCGEFGE